MIQSGIAAEVRERLETDIAVQFTIGMWAEQKTRSIDWMKKAMTASRLGEGQAAESLGVDRATLNRWLNGKVDPPFGQVQKFYACFGAADEHDHPFQPREVLNLGGYFQTVVYLKQWLQEQGLEKKPFDPKYAMTSEVFLCLYYFYANIETKAIQTKESQRELEGFIQKTLNVVDEVIPKENRELRTPSEFQEAMAHWGLAWLVCLTLIAEDENGIEPYRVLTKRPVRLR